MKTDYESVGFILAGACSYTKLTFKHCFPVKYNSYATVSAAQNACSADSNCKSVYDQGCNEGAHDIYLCPTSLTSYYNSYSSCIYEKSC